MPKKLFSQDLETQISQIAHEDGEGNVVLETVQDVRPFLEENKASYAQIDERARWGEFTKIASIPFSVIQDLNKKGILKGFHIVDPKKLKEWLNDPDQRFFRTRPGRI
jgi:hypothetical protein